MSTAQTTQSTGRHVFVSYAREDAEYVDQLINFLQAEGLDTFHDRRTEFGDDWIFLLEQMIRTCRAFVVVMSPASAASRWVRNEIIEAQNSNRPVLTMLLEGKGFLGVYTLQRVDVRSRQMPSAEFVKRLHDLVAANDAGWGRGTPTVFDQTVLPWGDTRVVSLRDSLAMAYPTASSIRDLLRGLAGLGPSAIDLRRGAGIGERWTRILDRAAEIGSLLDLLAKIGDDPSIDEHRRSHIAHAATDLRLASRRSSPTRMAIPGGDDNALGRHRFSVNRFLAESHHLPTGGDLIRLLWRAGVPIAAPLPVALLSNLDTVVELFDRRGSAHRGVPPIMALLEYVAAWLGPDGDPLRSIVDSFASTNGIALEDRDRIRLAAAAADDAPTQVSIFIRLGGQGRRIRPSIWLYQRTHPVSFKWDSPTPVTVKQVQQSVEGALEAFESLLSGFELENVRFEFMLPWDILHEVVDQWKFSDGRELGSRSEVVVRSLDRMNGAHLETAWRRRSELIDNPNGSVCYGVGSPECAGLDGGNLACCATRSPYVVPRSWKGSHHQLDMIKEGLPVALWCRDPNGRLDLKSIVDEAFSIGGLRQLPRVVLRRRRLAAVTADQDLPHPDRHLALLWDDYYSRPESFSALRTPPREGERP